MLARIATGLVGIPVVIALTFCRGGVPFAVAAGLVAAIALIEFYRAVGATCVKPKATAGLLAAVLLVHAAFNHNSQHLAGLYAVLLTFLLLVSLALELTERDRKPVANLGATVLGVDYVGWLLSHLVRLRSLPGTITVGPWTSEKGAWLVMFVLLSTWACDTAAYFVGRFFGKRKLAPSLSPGKTIEGSVGGFVGSVLLALLTGLVIRLPTGHALAMGMLVGTGAQVGDLVASRISVPSFLGTGVCWTESIVFSSLHRWFTTM